MHKLLTVIMGLLISVNTYALQIKGAIDNETITANISSLDVTRIFVQGDRIKNVKGVKGAYIRENDEEHGEIYLRPSFLSQHQAFTLLMTTEQGRHFTLLLNPIAVPSDTLMLIPKGLGRKSAERFEHALPYELLLSHLIKSMLLKKVPSGYVVREMGKQKPQLLKNKGTLRIKTIYKGFHFTGEIYELRNTKASIITIDEREFYSPGTCAISLESNRIASHKTIKVYRIVKHV